MDTANLQAAKPALFVAALGPQAVELALPLIHGLKSRGIRVETDYTGSSLKSQMKKADKSGAAYTLILGEQELQSHTAVLRNMQTKEQASLPFSTILEELKTRLR
jgi:histidyl-tRNA synthetase